MADTPPPSSPPPKGKKKVPTWYYVAGAGALVVLYYFYAKSKASSSAAAAPTAGAPTASSAGTAAGSYGNAGDLAALAPYLTQQSAQSSTSGAAYTPPTGQTLTGGGYGGTQAPITDASGNTFQLLTSNDQISALSQSGQTGWIQSQPGVFLPTTPNQPLPFGTPLYEKIPSGGTG